MPLICECGEWEDPDWWFDVAADYSTLQTSRRKRCASCRRLIGIGELVLEFPRWRGPCSDIEITIYGDDGQIFLAPLYHCEVCADLFLSLKELGFCVEPDESMLQLVRDYAAMQQAEREK